MVERSEVQTVNPEDSRDLHQVLSSAEAQFTMSVEQGDSVSLTTVHDLIRRTVGIESSSVIMKVCRQIREAGLIQSSPGLGKSVLFDKDQTLAITAFFWTVKDDFSHQETYPYQRRLSDLAEMTRNNLRQLYGLSGFEVSDPSSSEEEFSLGHISYAEFCRGREKGTKYSETQDRMAVNGDNFREAAGEWDNQRLSSLYESLFPGVETLKLGGNLELRAVAERVIEISKKAGWISEEMEVDDVVGFQFRNLVANCLELMDLSGREKLGDLVNVTNLVAPGPSLRRAS